MSKIVKLTPSPIACNQAVRGELLCLPSEGGTLIAAYVLGRHFMVARIATINGSTREFEAGLINSFPMIRFAIPSRVILECDAMQMDGDADDIEPRPSSLMARQTKAVVRYADALACELERFENTGREIFEEDHMNRSASINADAIAVRRVAAALHFRESKCYAYRFDPAREVTPEQPLLYHLDEFGKGCTDIRALPDFVNLEQAVRKQERLHAIRAKTEKPRRIGR